MYYEFRLMDTRRGQYLSLLNSQKEKPQVDPRAGNKYRRFCWILSCLLLTSAAVTISFTFPPSPWSLLLSGISYRVEEVIDPASDWDDNIWPIRAQTPWDISTDFAYPRSVEYDVQEGTWLRLDVHPISGDIVFDMIGDLYCLPGRLALRSLNRGPPIKALPILTGTPYDSDPHFSPNGDRLVFRSDAELGVENIWAMEWTGCEAMDLKRDSPLKLQVALENTTTEGNLLALGVQEDAKRKRDRLVHEGRLTARRVTNETYRWVSDARFHPSGSTVVATKWYTSGRSLGAGEGWMYSVPTREELKKGQKPITVGSGTRLVGRTLPLGWTSEDYGDQQIGPEQFIWNGNDTLIYSKNVADPSAFTYSKDVHAGIYAIFESNMTSRTTKRLVDSFAGGASRPELSGDLRTLAFVRRVRDKEALVLKDLQTGSIHNVWHGLTYDLTTIFAPMGTYPSFSFTPNDSAIIIWSAGQIYFVPLSVNTRGERIASTDPPHPIRFTAHIEKRLAETRHEDFDLLGLETRSTQKLRSFKDLRVDDHGRRVVFQGAGVNYWHDISAKKTTKIPVLDEEAMYFSPSFIHGAENFIIHVRWTSLNYSQFELADVEHGKIFRVTGLPLGRYFSPTVCECQGSKRQIAFIKGAGSYLSGDILATANPGLYIADITLPSSDVQEVMVQNIQFVPSEIDIKDRVNMRFLSTNKILLIQQSSRAFTLDLSSHTTAVHKTLASGEMSSEIAISSINNTPGINVAKHIAFVDFFHVHIVSAHKVGKNEAVWSKPGNATDGLARLSLDGGHDISWSRDGRYLFWFLGPYLHSLEVAQLARCSKEIQRDRSTYGISCVKSLVQFKRLDIAHSTDIFRMKKEASHSNSHSDLVIINNATILTMATGDVEKDLIQNGALIVQGGVITGLGKRIDDQTLPEGSTVIDANGGFVIPGFIDVHAHWIGFADRFPAKSWELETFLAYGVTTLHNPSAHNVESFVERSRVESGKMIGPRIFSVGHIIYGAGNPTFHQSITDMDEAFAALTRIKAEGGPASISYKNYNLPSRASRQRLLKAARNMTMLCVPEGGMNYDWDLTYIIDGMTTVEHAIPIPQLYDDVLTLFELSGTGYTPTHIVNYGGAWGEEAVWATRDIPNDPKLRRFTRHDILESLSETTSRPRNSFAFYNTSASAATMVRKGLLVNIGAHGEPPLGLNYHAELDFSAAGGLNNYEVLLAATASGAKTLGLFSSLGSLSPGKLADFLIFPPEVDLLSGQISNKTLQLLFVARGGRIWDASSMVEFWPVSGRKQEMPVLNAE